MIKNLMLVVGLPTAFLMAGFGAGQLLGSPASTDGKAAEAGSVAVQESRQAKAGKPAKTALPGPKGTPETARPEVVVLGRITVPIYKPRSTTYVVADLGVSTTDWKKALEYREGEKSARLRDAILEALTRASETPLLRGVSIDTDKLSSTIREEISSSFAAIDEVLFLALYKKDVPRS